MKRLSGFSGSKFYLRRFFKLKGKKVLLALLDDPIRMPPNRCTRCPPPLPPPDLRINVNEQNFLIIANIINKNAVKNESLSACY